MCTLLVPAAAEAAPFDLLGFRLSSPVYVVNENAGAAVITVIAAGFRDVAGRKSQQKPSYLPKTWKAAREQPTAGNIAPQQTNVVQQVARNVADVRSEVPADDLDVPTFLRRQAQKA